MSAATGAISSSSSVGYATQPAQTSALRRSLTSLSVAIQNGELAPASSILVAFFKANPQYTATADDGSQSQDPLAQAFQALATAISNNQVDAAQTAWTQVKGHLARDGVTSLGDGTTSTSEVPVQTEASNGEQIVSNPFDVNSGSDAAITAPLDGGDSSDHQSGVSGSLIGNWLTYQQGGTAAPATTISSGGELLDTAA